MSLTVVGIAMGAFVAFMSFQFGVWGFLGALFFMGIGALLGRAADARGQRPVSRSRDRDPVLSRRHQTVVER